MCLRRDLTDANHRLIFSHFALAVSWFAISFCLDCGVYGSIVYVLIAVTVNLSIIVKVRKNVGNYFEFFFAITNFVSDNNDGG